MTIDELTKYWHGHTMRYWPPEAVRHLGLSSEVVELLTRVGFPDDVDWTLTFPIPPAGLENEQFIPIALDDQVPIAIDRRHENEVWAMENGSATRFVNTTAKQFGECLVVYDRYRRSVVDADEKQALLLVEQAREHFMLCDVRALSSPEAYWSVILEQMEQGLL